MQNTLSARLTYRIMAVVLVMMVVITGVVYFTVREYMLDEAEERYLGFLLENHQEIRRKLSDVHVAAENNVHDIERDIDNPDMMFDHMQRIIRQNRSIVCCALLFKQDYYPSKGRLFVPCARKDAADSIIVSRIDNTYNSYFYREWFQNQLKADKTESVEGRQKRLDKALLRESVFRWRPGTASADHLRRSHPRPQRPPCGFTLCRPIAGVVEKPTYGRHRGD